MADYEMIGDIYEKLKRMFDGTIEQMLEPDMDKHLGQEKIQPTLQVYPQSTYWLLISIAQF